MIFESSQALFMNLNKIISQIVAWISLTYRVVIGYLSLA